MKIKIIGRKGCTKCSKMEIVLKSKGYETDLVYPEFPCIIDGISVESTNDMHFPLYVINGTLLYDYKSLTDYITKHENKEC